MRVDGHHQPDQVERRPADGKEHEHHEHGDEVAHVAGAQAWPLAALHLPPHLDHQDPDAQVAEGYHADGYQEVHHHHGDGVGGAGRLGEGAGVDARVVLQGAHEEVGQDGHHGQRPHQPHQEQRVPEAEHAAVGKAVADVAVAVDGDGRDVEDGADHAQPHQEAAHLRDRTGQAGFIYLVQYHEKDNHSTGSGIGLS